jgi:hypothetical protein
LNKEAMMREQIGGPKVQALLASLIVRYESTTPKEMLTIAVIIRVSDPLKVASVQRAVESTGGTVVVTRQLEIEVRLLPSVIESIASMKEVVNIRLARLHSAH